MLLCMLGHDIVDIVQYIVVVYAIYIILHNSSILYYAIMY